MKVYVHFAEMDTWLVHIADDEEPSVLLDVTRCEPDIFALVRSLFKEVPAYCDILCKHSDVIEWLRSAVFGLDTKFSFTVGTSFRVPPAAETELIDEALAALKLVPGIFQSVGKIKILAMKCKHDSKLGKERWQQYDNLNNQGAELMSKIRQALRLLRTKL